MKLVSPSDKPPHEERGRHEVGRKPVGRAAPQAQSLRALTPPQVTTLPQTALRLEKPEVVIPITARCQTQSGATSVHLELGGILDGLIVELRGRVESGTQLRKFLQWEGVERIEFSGLPGAGTILPELNRLVTSALREITGKTDDGKIMTTTLRVLITELEALHKEIVTDNKVKALGKTTKILLTLADGIYDQTDRSVPHAEVNKRALALRRRADARLLFVDPEQREQNRLLDEAIALLERAHEINPREPSVRMKLASVLIESVSRISKEPGDTLRIKQTAMPYLRRLFVATRLLDEFKGARHAANGAAPDFFGQLMEVLDLLRIRIREHQHLHHPYFHAYSALVEIWFPRHPHAMQLPGRQILTTLLREHRIRGVFQSLLSVFEHDEGYSGELATLDMAIRLRQLHGVKVHGVNIPLNGEWGVVQECSIHSTDIDLVLSLAAGNELGLEEGLYWVEVKKRKACRTVDQFSHELEKDRRFSTQLVTQQLWCDIFNERHKCPIKRLMIWCGPDCPDTPIKFKSYPGMDAFPPIAFCRTTPVTFQNNGDTLPFPSWEAFKWMIGPGGLNRTMAKLLEPPK